MSIADRVKIRIPEINSTLLTELVATAQERITLRLRLPTYPPELDAITVNVVCAMYNRSYHEGIKHETVDTFGTTFMDDIMAEYGSDFDAFLRQRDNGYGVVRFL